MRKSPLSTLLFLSCGCIANAASDPSIAVFIDFENEPSGASVLQMKAEADSILAPSGLALDWYSLSHRPENQTFPDLVVLKFRGSCQVRNPAMDSELGPAIEGVALASTTVQDGRVLPFSDVRCDEVRHFLAANLAASSPPDREAIYGKALGRVVAHELYHILAATEKHGKQGVARQSHSRRELTSDRFRFSDQETALLHDVKRRALLAGEGSFVTWQ